MQELLRDGFRASVAQFADAYVLTLSGELDLHVVDALAGELAAIEEAGGTRVIVDLVGVSFLDSTALAVLVASCKRLRAGGGRLVLVSNDPRTLRVLEITGLDRVFEVERSLADAVGGVLDGVAG